MGFTFLNGQLLLFDVTLAADQVSIAVGKNVHHLAQPNFRRFCRIVPSGDCGIEKVVRYVALALVSVDVDVLAEP